MAVLVEFVGHGLGEDVFLPVDYISCDMPVYQGVCAFCEGWPIGNPDDEDAPISKYMREQTWAHSCPYCGGRAS